MLIYSFRHSTTRILQTALSDMLKDIGRPEITDEIMMLWLEYEEGSSVEASVAKELDKFEMIVQADEYEQVEGKRLDRFFESTLHSFRHPEVNCTTFDH